MNKKTTKFNISPLCDKKNADLFLISHGLPTSRNWASKAKTPSTALEPPHKPKRDINLSGIKCNTENAHLFLEKFGFRSKIDVKNAICTQLRLK
jgi:hypothetical protein